MKNILEEYGEVFLGATAALIIMALAVFLFTSGGTIEEVIAEIVNKAI